MPLRVVALDVCLAVHGAREPHVCAAPPGKAMSVTRQQPWPVRARFEELETVAELPMHVAERLAWRLHLDDRRRLRPRRAATALLRQRGAAGDVRRSARTSSKSFFARMHSSAIESPSISVNAPELTWYLRPVPEG